MSWVDQGLNGADSQPGGRRERKERGFWTECDLHEEVTGAGDRWQSRRLRTTPAGNPGRWLRCGNIFGFTYADFFSRLQRYLPTHNMATMAAAIAASLPTVQAAPAPAAPTKQTLPASWNKNVDPEAEIPTTSVQIDGLVRLHVLLSRRGAGPPNDDSGNHKNHQAQPRFGLECAWIGPWARPRWGP